MLANIDLSTLNLSLCQDQVTTTSTTTTNHTGLTCSTPYYLKAAYLPLHGYLALIVCILGTAFNMVNMMVLTHRDMRNNPINLILTGIAVADCLVMVEYIPFNIHMYLFDTHNSEEREQKVRPLNIRNIIPSHPSFIPSMAIN